MGMVPSPGTVPLRCEGMGMVRPQGRFREYVMTEGQDMAGIGRVLWGTHENRDVFLFTLTNRNGMQATITNLGGILVTLTAPDRDGHFADVVLGFDNLESYRKPHPFFGALVGRYANRIADASFTLDDLTYQLVPSEG